MIIFIIITISLYNEEKATENNEFRIEKLLLYGVRLMTTGSAVLRFDWSRAGIGMDLLVFLYSDKKSGLDFLSRQGRSLDQLPM